MRRVLRNKEDGGRGVYGHRVAVMTGAVWTRERLHRAGRVPDAICPHCGAEHGDAEHLWGPCPKWEHTRWQARRGERVDVPQDRPGLYRGIPTVPNLGRAADQAEVVVEGDYEGLRGKEVWTDGHGRHPGDPLRRTCAWGLTGEGGISTMRGRCQGPSRQSAGPSYRRRSLL